MAALDEVRARAALAEMQDRLARGPLAALGLTARAAPEDVRAAFLQLTKRYHPVRFGRMATDIQKLANEVFLALRAAHDAAARTLRRPTGTLAAAPTPPAGVPVLVPSAPGSGRIGAVPVAVPSAPGSGRIGAVPVAVPSAPGSGRIGAVPVAVPSAPGSGRIGAVPVAVPSAPSSGRIGVPSRAAGPAANHDAARPAVPPGAPISRARPAVSRPAAPRPPAAARPIASAPPAAARDEAAVLDLLARGQWDRARSALHQLSARDPSSKRIRALACYARGREAQLDRRLDDARVDLQDALALDPDLQVARTALSELFTRRK